MTIEQAINQLRREYEKALHNPTVGTPLAYALYHTWRFVDARKKYRKEEGDGEEQRHN
ncbi:MAG: hypothetical protein II008_05065 [Oscillospiraceae bacterium]|nr:hypothetical protein [Oscillospiraceae bacterium]